MSSSLDMSLDDISKARGPSSRGGRGGARGGRGGNAGGSQQQQQSGSGPVRNKQRHSGGGGAGGFSSRQQQPYARAPIATPLQYAAPIYAAPAPQTGGQWKRDLYASEAPQQQQQQQQQPVKKISGDTIHVSNLASDVSDEDVREIFERIGKVTSCVVNFNSSGKSTGTATVTFARKQDAEKAVEDYDEAEVDGRAMKLKLVGTVVSAPVVVKKQRPVVQVVQQQQQPQVQPQLAYLPQQLFAQQPLQFAQSYQPQQRAPKQQQQQQAPARGGASRGGRGGRGGASNGSAPAAAAASSTGAQRGGKGGKGARAAPKEVSGADLDLEMDAYHRSREAAAAPAPAAAGQPTTV